jgi:hypothetical protein
MDRNGDNPGMVEREMDETPVEREGMSGSGRVEREGMQDGEVERESMRGAGAEREGLQAGPVERESPQPGEHGDARQAMEAAPSHTAAGDQRGREGRVDGMLGAPRETERGEGGSPERGMDGGRAMGEDRPVQPGTSRDW